MAHDVFISYSHEDRTVANAVVATLESHGIRCWIAPRDILPGEDWGEAILDAIKETHAVVLIFSSHSNESDQIKREVERTVHQGIAVIPFRIEDVLPSKTLEYFISTQHWLDALTPPLEDHLAHLAETITVLLARKRSKAKISAQEPAPAEAASRLEVKPQPEPSPATKIGGFFGKIPLVWIASLAGLLLMLIIIVGIWQWSRPLATTPPTPAPAPPIVAPPAPPIPIPQQPAKPVTTPGPVFSVRDGKLLIAPPQGLWRVMFNQDMVLPNDMDVSVSLTYQQVGDPSKGSGLIFWAKDFSDFYALVLTATGEYAVQHFTANRWLDSVPFRKVDNFKKGENTENFLRVITKGSWATVYINQQEVTSFTGNPPQGGCLVGLKGSSGPKGVNIAAFANLQVIGPTQVLGFKPDPKQPDIIRLSKIATSPPAAPPVSPAPPAKTGEQPKRGMIGVQVQTLTPELAKSFGLAEPKGALVAEVAPGSPAQKAGLQRGDIITEFYGRPIQWMEELPVITYKIPPGTEVGLKVLRDGKEETFKLRVAEATKEHFPIPSGLVLRDLDQTLAQRFRLPENQGLVVLHVEPGFAADKAGLRAGDLILDINGQTVAGIKDYQRIKGKLAKGSLIRMLIKRNGRNMYLTIEIPQT